ncbi:MAG: N-6 DNA methylase [Fischerella sp.]|nr:N-6 DNA methylase [Fischerella sp.]
MQLLEPAENLLNNISSSTNCEIFEFRLQMLEAAASRLGGFSLKEYNDEFKILPMVSYEFMNQIGEQLIEVLSSIPIHPSLALSALSREPLGMSEQRKTGAYYTDYRLAQHIATLGKTELHENSRVLDPACGTGILLVAISVALCGIDRKKARKWLSQCVFATDLSPTALRGARLALASLSDDLNAIREMWSHWRVQDSLIAPSDAWKKMSPQGFDLVVGNPPWEKIKLTRHEYLNETGDIRYYGEEYYNMDSKTYHTKRNEFKDYALTLKDKFKLLGSGEIDLYMAFFELFSQLVCPGGKIAMLIPAGLIRSQGTEILRQFLFENGRNISIEVIENRAKFFTIDTRFKFLALNYIRRKENDEVARDLIYLRHATGTTNGMKYTGVAQLGRATLNQIRPDLTIPEVRNKREWHLFVSMIKSGIKWSDISSKWYPAIVREVDMTGERDKFQTEALTSCLPVVEGRMVQAHRFGAKVYITGRGRKAIWTPRLAGQSLIAPQFWIKKDNLYDKILERSKIYRAGFCDIAGQTNERSMMAAIIPPGVVCGNKVPTITFPNDPSEQRLLLWVGIANSLPFDWMLRRVLTTTVNFFLLLGLTLPNLEPNTLPGRYIVHATRELMKIDTMGKFDPWRMAELRANIDLVVLAAYGLGYQDLVIMLQDFPLLDRGQPPIYNEKYSTITRDFLLQCAARRYYVSDRIISERVEAARMIGAFPYIPSEMVSAVFDNKKEVQQSE